MRPQIYLFQNGIEITEINFGTVEVGTSKTLDITIKNKGSVSLFDVEYSIPHPDVKILNEPKKIDSNSESILSVKYTPTEESEGLKVKLYIKGVYVT